MLALKHIEQLQSVKPRALHPDVEKHQAGAAAGNFIQPAIGIMGLSRLIAFVLEDPRDQVADIVLVINDQNIQSHLFLNNRR